MDELHLRLDLDTGLPAASAAALAAAIAGGRAARRPAARSACTTPMAVPSRKMGQGFAADSPGEAEAILLADVLERVVAFRPQVVEVRYSFGGRVRRAFPDIGVELLDGSVELWEVKPERRDDEMVRRLGRLSAALRGHGIGYRVRTPTWLRREPRLANARRLAMHADRPVPARLRDAVSEAVAAPGCDRLGALRSVLDVGVADILAAAARGWFAVDVESGPLGDGTAVRAARPGARSGAYGDGEQKGEGR